MCVYPDISQSCILGEFLWGHFSAVHICFFEMVAMPFPCNGLLLCCVNLPKVLLKFCNKSASYSIPYFNLFLYFIVDSQAMALNSLGLFTYRKKGK